MMKIPFPASTVTCQVAEGDFSGQTQFGTVKKMHDDFFLNGRKGEEIGLKMNNMHDLWGKCAKIYRLRRFMLDGKASKRYNQFIHHRGD